MPGFACLLVATFVAAAPAPTVLVDKFDARVFKGTGLSLHVSLDVCRERRFELPDSHYANSGLCEWSSTPGRRWW